MGERMVLHLNQLESPFSKKKIVLSKDETNFFWVEIGPLILKEKIKTTPENRIFFQNTYLSPQFRWVQTFQILHVASLVEGDGELKCLWLHS